MDARPDDSSEKDSNFIEFYKDRITGQFPLVFKPPPSDEEKFRFWNKTKQAIEMLEKNLI